MTSYDEASAVILLIVTYLENTALYSSKHLVVCDFVFT